MAAEQLVRHLLRSEDSKQLEKNIYDFITSGNDKDNIDLSYLESLDVVISHIVEIYANTCNETELVSMTMLLDKIVNDICLPLLRVPRPSIYDCDKGNKLKQFQLTYKLVSSITFGSPVEIGQQVWTLLLRSLKNFIEECKHGFGQGHEVDPFKEVLEVATALDLLGSLLESTCIDKWDCERLRKHEIEKVNLDQCVFEAVLDVLKVVRSESLLFKITGKILPRLLSMNEEKFFKNTKAIWEIVKILLVQEENEYEDYSGFFGSYAVLSSLADMYFTPRTKPVFNVHHDPAFWTMLQTGLVNIDPLVRKRCLYLLQKAVDMSRKTCNKLLVNTSIYWWSPGCDDALLSMWQQYVFLFEILEEKQLHVIQPVLPRLSNLIDATKKRNDSQFPLLHVSWLTVLIHRAAIHENRFIKKWAVMSLMTLDLQKVPLVEDTSTRHFTSGTLIMLLKEPSLYAKNDGEGRGEPSRLSKELAGFFKKCFNHLDDNHKAEFVNEVLSSIHKHNISHVPLTYICQGLANIPRVPMLGADLLTNLRLILSNMTSHSVVLRGAVQSFLLKTFMNVLHARSVSLDEVFLFLGLFVREESLCRKISLWEDVGQWLFENVDLCQRTTKDLFGFLEGKIREFLTDSSSSENRTQAVRLAKFILLCCDCSVISCDHMARLFDIVFLTISKAQSNAYLPISHCWQAVELLRAFFHELRPVVPSEAIADNIVITLSSRFHEVILGLMHCVLRTIGQDDEPVSFQGYRTCFALLNEVRCLWRTQKFPGNLCQKYQALVMKLADSGLHVLSAEVLARPTTVKAWLRFVFAVRWMAFVLEFSDIPFLTIKTEHRLRFFEFVRTWNLVSNLRYPNSCYEVSNAVHSESKSILKQDDWRVVAKDYVATQWECVSRAVREKRCACVYNSPVGGGCTLAGNPPGEIVDACVEALSLVSGRAFLPCLQTLQLFLPKLLAACDEHSCLRLLETAWNVLHEIRMRYSAQFWPALEIVVKIVFAAELLTLPAEHVLTSRVGEYWNSLLEIAHDQSGLVSVAVSHICKVFSGFYKHIPMDVRMQSLKNHVGIIADICIFGPVHKKDLRLLFDTTAYIKSLGQDCGAVCLTKRKEFESESACVRVDILALLLGLDAGERKCTSFIIQLIETLIERNQILSEAKASRFLNSENHRQKQRLWQIISAVVCRVNNDVFASEFAMKVFQALQSDNQTSVRFLMEWILVRVLSKHMEHLDLIWQQFQNIFKKRLGYVASLINIVTHIFLAIEEPKIQTHYLFRLLPVIIPCAFLNHSQTRAYLLEALRLISDVCTGDVWSRVTKEFPIVESCLAFADNVVEGDKEKGRLQKDRALFSLHPVDDFSVEVIFETVPRIAGVVEDEIVPPEVFLTEGSLPWVEVENFPLYSQRRGVERETGSKKERKSVCSEPTPKTDTVERNNKVKTYKASEGFETHNTDVQKKITPWQVNASPEQDLDLFDLLQQRPIQRRVGSLIVVASLIDRAPNLGGLCRTCEIFGASKLVLGSKHVVSETGFRSVSVSSEKWVELEEVKVTELKSYLKNMKKEGFTIVGVEQTAHSKKLTNFQFPSNTVLVLGNEKAGIPVELIQLLEECVEIPQQGIIRSLNVHVSGALFIWEYSRQYLNDG